MAEQPEIDTKGKRLNLEKFYPIIPIKIISLKLYHYTNYTIKIIPLYH